MLIVMSYSMCTLSREIYSEAVGITIKIGTSAIGKIAQNARRDIYPSIFETHTCEPRAIEPFGHSSLTRA